MINADAVVIPVVILAPPDTSSVYCGVLVPIPTLPSVVKRDPRVLLLPVAANVFCTNTIPADTLVSTRF